MIGNFVILCTKSNPCIIDIHYVKYKLSKQISEVLQTLKSIIKTVKGKQFINKCFADFFTSDIGGKIAYIKDFLPLQNSLW